MSTFQIHLYMFELESDLKYEGGQCKQGKTSTTERTVGCLWIYGALHHLISKVEKITLEAFT